MSQPKIKYQQYSFQVASAGQIIPIDFETDKLYKKITGVNVVMTNETNKHSTLELSFNTVDVFPEDFEVLRIMFRNGVPFGYEYHELNEKAEGSRVKGTYTDVDNSGTFPYKVTISLKLENE